jgi:hypothetical protein
MNGTKKPMKFLYGCRTTYCDVTQKVAEHCIVGNKIILPLQDTDRAQVFGDVWHGMLKNIKILHDDGSEVIVQSGSHWSAPQDIVTFDFSEYKPVKPAFKYRLAAACMFKNSLFYLKEWLAFHKAVGVEHFFLCDNDSTDDFMPILAPYLARGEITLIHKSGTPDTIAHWERDFHLPFYNQVIKDNYATVEWLACLDIDEFLVPCQHQTILEVLEKYTDHAWVSVFWQCYGTSNIGKLGPDDLLVEKLIWRLPTSHEKNGHAKVICQPQFCNFTIDPHWVKCAPGKTQFTLPVDVLRLNHYNQGDEYFWHFQKLPFYIRCTRYNMNQLRHDLLCYELFNNEKDTVIHQFVDQMKAVFQLNATYSPPPISDDKNAVARWYDTVAANLFHDPKLLVQEFRKQFLLPENVSSDELLQQEILVRFVKRRGAVLEISADAIHNTLLLAMLLENDQKLVVVNNNPDEVATLQDMKKQHDCLFQIESRTLTPSSTWQNTYHVCFKTLIAFSVPTLYTLLKDDSKTLLQFETIIVSNNYTDILDHQKLYNLLAMHKFEVMYTHSGGSGACESCFFQVFVQQ